MSPSSNPEFNFSKRTGWDLTPNALSRLIEEKKSENIQILNLTESNPTACGLDYPQEKILKAFSSAGMMEYHPSAKGSEICRQIISDYYKTLNINSNIENIFLTASTSEAYSYIFRLITSPGDNILIPSPSYPLFDFLAQLNDIEIQNYPLEYHDGWHIDFDALSKKINSQTRAILLVHPNNPTGSYVSKEDIQQLNQIAGRHQLALVSDEVFFDYAFDNTSSFSSFAGNRDVLTFTLNGISKMLALPQMKLGWMVITGPQKLQEAAVQKMEIITDTYLSVNTPVQTAFPEIMKFKNLLQKQIQERLKLNKEKLFDLVRRHPDCEYLKSDGGWYAVLRMPKIYSDEEWALKLLEEDNILIHPGHFYNFHNEGHIILSLLTVPHYFEKGLNCVFRHLNAFDA